MHRLSGKIALISGAAGGIASEVARLFARNGAKIVLGDLREKESSKVVEDIRGAGGEAAFVHLDVTRSADWDAAVAFAVDRFGCLTTLFNGAGICLPGGIVTETAEGWDRTVAINQTGTYLGMKAAAPALMASGNGAIVNMSSVWGNRGSADALSYHATKGAVRLMTRAAAIEFARQGIRANTISPGMILTPMATGYVSKAMAAAAEEDASAPDEKTVTDALQAIVSTAIPIGYGGKPEDIAYAALYLCSDEAKYVTGAELHVDGGWQAG